jgi:type I restriction enzyme, S subunit
VTDEVPFSVPNSWSLVRLKDLVCFGGGHTPSMDISDNWMPATVNWVTSKDVKTKILHETQIKVSKNGAKELTIYPPSSLTLVMRSGILRHSVPIAILDNPFTVNQDIKVLIPFISAMANYIYVFFLASAKFILGNCSKDGTTVESLDTNKIKNVVFPLPGLDEQKRIIDFSGSVLRKMDSISESMSENTTNGENLKRKILAYFFNSDSDKSYYSNVNQQVSFQQEELKRIYVDQIDLGKSKKAEKERVSQAMVIDDKSRGWIFLSAIFGGIFGGGTPSKTERRYWNGNIPWCSVKDLGKNLVINSTKDKISQIGLENSSSKIVQKGEVILCTRISVGTVRIAGMNMAINQDLKGILLNKSVCKMYFIYFMSSIKLPTSGTTVKGISLNKLLQIPFPYLPIKKQEQIAAIIATIFSLIDEIVD